MIKLYNELERLKNSEQRMTKIKIENLPIGETEKTKVNQENKCILPMEDWRKPFKKYLKYGNKEITYSKSNPSV